MFMEVNKHCPNNKMVNIEHIVEAKPLRLEGEGAITELTLVTGSIVRIVELYSDVRNTLLLYRSGD